MKKYKKKEDNAMNYENKQLMEKRVELERQIEIY